MGEGGKWKNEFWAELRPGRRVKLLLQVVGALRRRNGVARGIYNRLKQDVRSSGKQIPAEAQRRLNSLVPGGGFSAYQMAFGPNPVELFG